MVDLVTYSELSCTLLLHPPVGERFCHLTNSQMAGYSFVEYFGGDSGHLVAIVEAVIPNTRMVSNQPVHRKFGKRYFPFS